MSSYAHPRRDVLHRATKAPQPGARRVQNVPQAPVPFQDFTIFHSISFTPCWLVTPSLGAPDMAWPCRPKASVAKLSGTNSDQGISAESSVHLFNLVRFVFCLICFSLPRLYLSSESLHLLGLMALLKHLRKERQRSLCTWSLLIFADSGETGDGLWCRSPLFSS